MFKENTALQYKPIVITPENREQWLKEKEKGLGGSEIAAVLGYNPYKTPYKLWQEKTGRVDQFKGNNITESGQFIEDGIARWWEYRSGNKLIKSSDDDVLYIHPEKSFVRGTPDRRFFNKNETDDDGNLLFNGKGVLEVKESARDKVTTSERYCQLQWYCGILGYDGGTIVVKSPFDREIYWDSYSFDPDFFSLMMEQAEHFWTKHVLADVPPDPISKEDIKELFPSHVEEKIVEATDFVKEDVDQLKETQRKKKEYEEKEKEIKDRIISFAQDADTVKYGDDILLTYRKTKDSTKFDEKSFEKDNPKIYNKYLKTKNGYRRLNIK